MPCIDSSTDHPDTQVQNWVWVNTYRYILVGWTSIYQIFWCSPGVQGFDTLPILQMCSSWICTWGPKCKRILLEGSRNCWAHSSAAVEFVCFNGILLRPTSPCAQVESKGYCLEARLCLSCVSGVNIILKPMNSADVGSKSARLWRANSGRSWHIFRNMSFPKPWGHCMVLLNQPFSQDCPL